MYLFALVSMPLSFFTAIAWSRKGAETVWRAFARGLLFGIPGTILWLLALPLSQPFWGSPFVVLSLYLRYWLLPFGLTAAAFSLAVGFHGLERGSDYERLVAFTAGSMSVFCIATTVITWGQPGRVYALLVPVLLASSAIVFPVAVEEAAKDGLPGAFKHVAIIAAAFLVAALGLSMYFMRMEWAGLIVSLLYCAGALFFGLRRLTKRTRPFTS
ncbi:MAG: hypothetical protein JXM71_05360 [Spirochaetales bacterium]|nr:hypothetical protein [Spirochaetales bacterium]